MKESEPSKKDTKSTFAFDDARVSYEKHGNNTVTGEASEWNSLWGGSKDRRSGDTRRVLADRRIEVRFEPNAKDRRQSNGRRADDLPIWHAN